MTEGEDGAARSVNNERRPLLLAAAPPKSSDIDDRFGRFDVKDMILGDETRSLVSDSWSTDVLGSDIELVNDATDRSDRQSDRCVSLIYCLDLSIYIYIYSLGVLLVGRRWRTLSYQVAICSSKRRPACLMHRKRPRRRGVRTLSLRTLSAWPKWTRTRRAAWLGPNSVILKKRQEQPQRRHHHHQ